MDDFLLVIDTESSALPKKWNAPFNQVDKWPHVVQVSWLVYRWDGTKIKQEDHYIRRSDYGIDPSSRAIHHISDELLLEKGESRDIVLELLQKDLDQYRPIVIGHFVELDYKLLNVEFCRIGKNKSPLEGLPLFCTMLASVSLPYMETNRQMRLADLYYYLFAEEQPFPHNALYDALATARCYFRERELLSLGPSEMLSQRPFVKDERCRRHTRVLGFVVAAAALLLLMALVCRSFR